MPPRLAHVIAQASTSDLRRCSESLRRRLASSTATAPDVLVELLLDPVQQLYAAANPATPQSAVHTLVPDLSYLRADGDGVEAAVAIGDHRRDVALAHAPIAVGVVEDLLEDLPPPAVRLLLANPQLPLAAARLLLHAHPWHQQLWLDRTALTPWDLERAWEEALAGRSEPEWVLSHPSCPLWLATHVGDDSTSPYQELAVLHPQFTMSALSGLLDRVLSRRSTYLLGPACWAAIATRADVTANLLPRIPASQLFAAEPALRVIQRLDTAAAFLSFTATNAATARQVEWLPSAGPQWRWDSASLIQTTAD